MKQHFDNMNVLKYKEVILFMNRIDKQLLKRSSNKCEICQNKENLTTWKVDPKDEYILVCNICKEQIEDNTKIDQNHMHCLSDSMWNEENSVKVVVYRLLYAMRNQDLLDMMYLEDDILLWAKYTLKEDSAVIHKDVYGIILKQGDTVGIIKDLNVKGTSFVAKQGTSVRNIGLVIDDATHIEGRVNGVKIYIKTCFVKKQQ